MEDSNVVERCTQYWINNKEEYAWRGYRDNIVEFVQEFLPVNTVATFHEFGCNRGFNLTKMREQYKNLFLSGNDINLRAYKRRSQGFCFQQKNTIDLLRGKQQFDYGLGCAHFMHLPNEQDEILSEQMQHTLKKGLFLLEPIYEEGHKPPEKGNASFNREYSTLFEGFVCTEKRLVQKQNRLKAKGGSYYLMWLEKENE